MILMHVNCSSRQIEANVVVVSSAARTWWPAWSGKPWTDSSISSSSASSTSTCSRPPSRLPRVAAPPSNCATSPWPRDCRGIPPQWRPLLATRTSSPQKYWRATRYPWQPICGRLELWPLLCKYNTNNNTHVMWSNEKTNYKAKSDIYN